MPSLGQATHQSNPNAAGLIGQNPQNPHENNLVRAKEARKILGDMPKSTFYDYIQTGIIPPGKYLGTMRVWRVGELWHIYEKLLVAEPRSTDSAESAT